MADQTPRSTPGTFPTELQTIIAVAIDDTDDLIVFRLTCKSLAAAGYEELESRVSGFLDFSHDDSHSCGIRNVTDFLRGIKHTVQARLPRAASRVRMLTLTGTTGYMLNVGKESSGIRLQNLVSLDFYRVAITPAALHDLLRAHSSSLKEASLIDVAVIDDKGAAWQQSLSDVWKHVFETIRDHLRLADLSVRPAQNPEAVHDHHTPRPSPSYLDY